MKMHATDRYQRAFAWMLQCASDNPGVRATASIGELRLSCWLTENGPKIQSWYVPAKDVTDA